MSIYSVSLSILSLSPKVWVEDDCLIARTSRMSQVLTLGASTRRVTVDPRIDRIRIETRSLWVRHSDETLRFRQISHFKYGFDAVATSWDLFGNARDSLESYSISAICRDGRQVLLLAFRGEGSVLTGGTGVLLGDSVVDHEGNQGEASRSYLDSLQAFTGIGLSPNASVIRRM